VRGRRVRVGPLAVYTNSATVLGIVHRACCNHKLGLEPGAAPGQASYRKPDFAGTRKPLGRRWHDECSMAYHTVFDVAWNGFQWTALMLTSTGACIFLLIGLALRRSADPNLSFKGLIVQAVGALGFVGGLVFLVADFAVYHEASRALSNHDYAVAEGVVTDFVPMPVDGHAIESFRVNGVNFSYGGWGATVFNSDWNKGTIHNGVNARISYRGSDILRIEAK
jgi:hypothetical protein